MILKKIYDWIDIDQLLLLYKFYCRDMYCLLLFIFGSCEPLNMLRANPGIGGHFRKLNILRFLQNYDDYNCIYIKLKALSLSFI